MPVIPALGRLRQEDGKFKDRLGYVVRPCLSVKKRRNIDRNVLLAALFVTVPSSKAPRCLSTGGWSYNRECIPIRNGYTAR
jgi:hypothetical protein